MMTARKGIGDAFIVAPQYPEPLELIAMLDTEEDANEEAWEWRRAGFYATRRRMRGRWAVFVGEGRERPAPEPTDPSRNAREQ